MNVLVLGTDSFLVFVNCVVGSSLLFVIVLAAAMMFRNLQPRTLHKVLFVAFVLAVALPATQAALYQANFGVLAVDTHPIESDLSTEANHHARSTSMDTIVHAYPLLGTSLMVAWALGVVIAFARLSRGYIMVRKIRSRVMPFDDKRVHQLLDNAAESVGLSQRPQIMATELNVGPMLLGICCPSIVIPVQLVDRLSDEELLCVLIHECEHLHRSDVLVAKVEQLAVCVYWFNPLAHWIRRRIVAARECACDDRVRSLVSETKHYASALLAVAEWSIGPQKIDVAIKMLPERSDLVHRVRRFRTKPVAQKHSKLQIWALCTAIMLMVGAASTPMIRFDVSEKSAVGNDSNQLTIQQEKLLAEQKLAYVKIAGSDPNDQIDKMIRKHESEHMRGLIVDLRKSDTADSLSRSQPVDDLYEMVQRQLKHFDSTTHGKTPVVVLVQIQGVSSAVMLRSLPPPKSRRASSGTTGPKDDAELRLAINMLSHV